MKDSDLSPLRDSKEKFKILKTDDDFHKLAKFVEPFFSKPLLDVCKKDLFL
jgi:hypothetical protein